MKRRKILLTAVILFIGINSLLVYLDEVEKVPRLSYIEGWSETVVKDMYETIETAGVLAPAEENNIYFDDEQGSFDEFLVEEGMNVNPGDDLFTYQAENYYETMTELETKQAQLEGEVEATEEALTSIATYRIPETDMETELEGDNGTLNMRSQSVEANYMQEQYLTEKQNELAQKEAELDSVQAQISELQTSGETITVESPYQGEVSEITESLDNPVVTIRSMELQAEGELKEAERMEVEAEMPVEVAVRENDVIMEGILNDVSNTPEATTVNGISVYPYTASLEEASEGTEQQDETPENDAAEDETSPGDATNAGETEDSIDIEESEPPQANDTNEETEQSAEDNLLPGYHADLTITTNESAEATAVREDHVFAGHLWKMTTSGLLAKQPVETGIEMDDLTEITEGATPGEMIADADNDQFRDGATFITPLELGDIEWQDFGKYGNVDWKRYFVIGLLSR
ncbi:HlyD family secretion protein [Lentibacillus persicus]|uniref:HlyD family secretion protein n=1 Tax=Lentibacillus persicus TaxID=640948 RepID=A0A1I2A893_9BACI|nr:HlyD family efflux transporter periplasmic adaptor subunit [Lentibacillus persicus]SFE40181.1 HlyD family secretion protein [Lentibacillus persicus]